MKTIAMSLLAALISTNAVAGVTCYVQVNGEAKALQEAKAGSSVLVASVGTIQAAVVRSLDTEDEVTDLQIKSENESAFGSGAYDLSKRPAQLSATVADVKVSLSCFKK